MSVSPEFLLDSPTRPPEQLPRLTIYRIVLLCPRLRL